MTATAPAKRKGTYIALSCLIFLVMTGGIFAFKISHDREMIKDDGDWKAIKDKPVINSFQEYLIAHPKGRHLEEAKKEIDDLEWSQVKNDISLKAIMKFIDEHPSSSHLAEAYKILPPLQERKSWQNACDTKTFDAYENFIKEFPNSADATAAKEKMDIIRKATIDGIEKKYDSLLKAAVDNCQNDSLFKEFVGWQKIAKGTPSEQKVRNLLDKMVVRRKYLNSDAYKNLVKRNEYIKEHGVICDYCEGTGKIQLAFGNNKPETCPKCKGLGKVLPGMKDLLETQSHGK